MLRAITLLLLFQLAGEALVRLLHWPVPGPVLGMALLFGALSLWRRSDRALEQSAAGLLRWLPLLFVPACVGVISQGDVLRREGLAIIVALVVSTLAAMIVTALTMQWLLRRRPA